MVCIWYFRSLKMQVTFLFCEFHCPNFDPEIRTVEIVVVIDRMQMFLAIVFFLISLGDITVFLKGNFTVQILAPKSGQ